ncbi:MAG TPA: hypothetical protein VGD01_19070 [Candidatus Elarobacter sp.]|jgi:hypothetical protein
MISRHLGGVAVLCAALLAACGGGGGGMSALPPPPATATPAVLTPVSLAIVIPSQLGAAKARKPQFVSPATALVAVAVNGGAPQTFPVASGAPCGPTFTTLAGSCTVYTVAAPVGPDTFAVTLYDASNRVLSQGTAAQTIVLNTTNTVNITFDGVVAALRIGFSNPSPPSGSPAKIAVTLLPVDAAGFTLVGSPGTLPSITVSDPDTSGATGLYLAGSDGTCATQAAAPAASVTTTQSGSAYRQVCLSYTGAAIGPVTISASIAGGPTGSAPFAPQAQNNAGVWVIGIQPSTNAVTLERVDASLNASLAIAGSQTNFGAGHPTGLAVDANGNVDVLIESDPSRQIYGIAVYSGTNGGNVPPLSVTTFTLPDTTQTLFLRGLASDTPSSAFVLGCNVGRGNPHGTCTVYRVALSGGTVTPSAAAQVGLLTDFNGVGSLRGDRQHLYVGVFATSPVNLPTETLFRYQRSPDGSLTAEAAVSTRDVFGDLGTKTNGDIVVRGGPSVWTVYPASAFVPGKITPSPAPVDGYNDAFPANAGATLAVDQQNNLFVQTYAGGDSTQPGMAVFAAGSHTYSATSSFQAFTFAAPTPP